MPSPPLSLRIDHFAQVAMQALLTKESSELAMIAEEKATGVNRYEILAKKSYEIAQYMEAEADNQPVGP